MFCVHVLIDVYSFTQGLPVLTVLGDSFPSRVGASLYSSFLSSSDDSSSSGTVSRFRHSDLYEVLAAQSLREFEDTAVRLALGVQREKLDGGGSLPAVSASLSHLKAVLHDTIVTNSGLFNTTRGVDMFIRGMQSIQEIEYLTRRESIYHVVVSVT